MSFIELSNDSFKELLGNVMHIYDMNGSFNLLNGATINSFTSMNPPAMNVRWIGSMDGRR